MRNPIPRDLTADASYLAGRALYEQTTQEPAPPATIAEAEERGYRRGLEFALAQLAGRPAVAPTPTPECLEFTRTRLAHMPAAEKVPQ